MSDPQPLTSCPAPSPLGYRLAMRVALVAGLFSAIVCALLLYDFSRREAKDPFEAPAMQALKAALQQQPNNEVLKQEYRAQDERARREHFRQRAFAHAGAMLLGISIAVFLIALKLAGSMRRTLPQPKIAAAAQDWESQWTPLARLITGGLLVLLAGVSIGLSSHWTSPLPPENNDQDETATVAVSPRPLIAEGPGTPVSPRALAGEGPGVRAVGSGATSAEPTAASTAAHPAPDNPTSAHPSPVARIKPSPTPPANPAPAPKPAQVASDDDLRKAWPCFRGPGGSGVSLYTNLPETWDGPSGKNIAWKTPVPLPGNNSPVVCGSRVFLSGADESHRQVFAFDSATGKLLWQRDVPSTPESAKPVKLNEDTGYAASTLATDGHYVAAIFANGDLAAFDYDGKLAWSQSLGIPDNSYGHGASLTVYISPRPLGEGQGVRADSKNLLIVPFDQGTVTAGRSKIRVLDIATGKPVWQKSRPVPTSWTTPIVVHFNDRDQLITFSAVWVIAYDVKDGTEIWRAKYPVSDVAPSPVSYGGVVYVANDPGDLRAIGVYGKGDVTNSHILWKGEDNMPDISSPLVIDCFVYVLTSGGMVTCYDTKTGEKLWEEDLGNVKFKSSPSMVGKNLWLIDEEGKGWILEPTREKCKRLGNTALGEACNTSPAFQDGCFYLRGVNNLFCIGKPLAGRSAAISPRPGTMSGTMYSWSWSTGEGQGVRAPGP